MQSTSLPSTYLRRHCTLEPMPHEALVDFSLAGFDVRTEAFTVIPTREKQRSVELKVFPLNFGYPQDFLLTRVLEVFGLPLQTFNRRSLAVWLFRVTRKSATAELLDVRVAFVSEPAKY